MKHERFHDPRLSPQQNKAAEMIRNGATRQEIEDELDITPTHLRVLQARIRAAGVQLPEIANKGQWGRRYGFKSDAELFEMRETLRAQMGKRHGISKIMARRLGCSPNAINVRLCLYLKKREGQAS